MPITPRVKICCISSPEEAQIAIRYGADALGLVSEMPSGPRVIPEGLITEIAASTPPFVSSVLLTSKEDHQSIVEQHGLCRTNAIQICSDLEPRSLEEIRRSLPGIDLIKVVHITDEASIDRAISFAPYVDAVLLDSGNRYAPVIELGGTGRTHDWGISRRIVEALDTPVILAGGLNPGNVTRAIDEVKPYGVDVCSGVRTDGGLDPDKLRSFIRQVKGD